MVTSIYASAHGCTIPGGTYFNSLLVTVAESTDAAEDWIAAHFVRQDMRKAGYTDIAVTLAMRSLVRKGMVDTRTDADFNQNEFIVYSATDRGMEWLETNQDRLVLERPVEGPKASSPFESDDDLPF